MSEAPEMIVPHRAGEPRKRFASPIADKAQQQNTNHERLAAKPQTSQYVVHSGAVDLTKRYRPFGISILSVLHIIGGIALLAMQLILFNHADRIREPLAELGISPLYLFIGIGIVTVMGLAAGLGMWFGEKWGWWCGVLYYLYAILRNAMTVITINRLSETIGQSSLGTGSLYLKYGGRIVVAIFILRYLFKQHVREYFRLTKAAQTATGHPPVVQVPTLRSHSTRVATHEIADAFGEGPLGLQRLPFAEHSASVSHLAAIELKKNYRKGDIDIPVLFGANLEVRQGELLAIVGQSGSGKSTLLHLLGTLDAPTAGEVHFLGQRIDNLPAPARDGFRNGHIGMIFQFYHLLPELTTLENVLAPLMIGSGVWDYLRKRNQCKARARELLEMVGLGHRLKHRPRELSGGEMQRVAIARALVAGPQVLLADEPTGNLDQQTGRDILQILRTLNRQQRLSIVMVTHDPSIAEGADRVVRLVSGRVEEAG